MLAELAQLQQPRTRWQLALGCLRVALFPSYPGGLLQTMLKQTTRSFFTTLGAAAMISLLLVLPLVILESVNQTITRQNAFGLFLLFGFLWLLPTMFIVLLAPLVRIIRAGDNNLAKPITLLFRVACLTLIAIVWGSLLIDQLPCFLGVPNCD